MRQSHFRHLFHDEKQQTTHLRIRVYLCQQEPIIARLISQYGLSVSITRAVLEDQDFPKQFDLELQGTIDQIQEALAYLVSVSLLVQGKPNVDGDGW